ncbi:MAG: ABC transporter ATP-binding protein, partial [Caldilineaceae bacterium]|nr:ABC transporter ATP-binding protein [Caldilineaceae bacterium]
CFAQAHAGAAIDQSVVPASFWSVQPVSAMGAGFATDADELLLLRGAVLIKVGRATAARRPVDTPERATLAWSGSSQPQDARETRAPAAHEPEAGGLHVDAAHIDAAHVDAVRARPTWELWRALRTDGLLTPSLLAVAALFAAAGVTVEAALLQGLMAVAVDAELGATRLGLLGGVLTFVVVLLLLEAPIAAGVLRTGRRLETRVRIAFLEKLPRLGDRYFHSRLISDMAQRAYGLHQLHTLPDLALRFLRLCCQLALTTAGIIWIYPDSAPLAVAALASAIGGTLLLQPLQTERDMRVRTYAGALSRFYLDALMGLMPVRTHSAERAVRREHEMLVVTWARENLALARVQVLAQSLTSLLGIGFAVWIVFSYIGARGEAAPLLLLLYWTLNLPVLGQALAASARQYPAVRNSMSRILEPLGAPEEEGEAHAAAPQEMIPGTGATTSGVAVDLAGVTVVAGGHTILHDVDLSVQPGEHVAIVGASGAGKSSLVGLLLGWHRPAAGRVRVDGAPLIGVRLQALRREIAWVDPSVQLWNRTLQENLTYGNGPAEDLPLSQALARADLYDVMERLPAGHQTRLGEGGGLVSGGEGQRVRLGRALLRPGVRLAILDEPFRGLDRGQRRARLAAARAQWADATLLCITHDIEETRTFDRVLVIEDGRIVEDGAPGTLAARPDSRYGRLLTTAATVQAQRWAGAQWQRLRLEHGTLTAVGAEPTGDDEDEDAL